MTTATHTGLLRAICECPHDTDLRLIFADYLDENGQEERAEFIRVQLALARHSQLEHCEPSIAAGWCPVCGDCCCGDRDYILDDPHPLCPLHRPDSHHAEWPHWKQRERELLTSGNALAWGPDRLLWGRGLKRPMCTLNHGTCSPGYFGTRFARGFVEAIECACQDWLDHGPALVLQQPIVEVRLMDREPQLLFQDHRQYGQLCNWWRLDDDKLPSRHISEPTWHNLHHVPASLFDHLKGGQRAEWTDYSRHYDTTAAAYADLSQACVAWARAQAGLPRLQY